MSLNPSCALIGIAKNEGLNLAEWIAVHSNMGFSKIFVYDNDSTDDTRRIVGSAAESTEVELIDWPSQNLRYQADAYEDAVIRFGGDHEWMAFLDLDEFLVSPNGVKIGTILSERPDVAGIAVNWQIYGSSGHEVRPPSTVTESFLYKATRGFPPNLHVKSIVRPGKFKSCVNPHFMQLEGNYTDITGEPIVWGSDGVTSKVNAVEVLRVNHYFVKSRAEWRAKRARGHRGAYRTEEEFSAYDRNEVYDPCAAMLGEVARLQSYVSNPPPDASPVPISNLPPDFSSEKYLHFNTDVAQAGVDAIDHYLTVGHAEGRRFK